MDQRNSVCVVVCALVVFASPATKAATIVVNAGGNLQAAIDAARPGDTILLAPGATFVGNFELPMHGGTDYITIRSAAADDLLPADGVRMSPAYAPYLPKIVSPNNAAALKTAASAGYWRLLFLEIGPTANSSGTALELGDGDDAQNALSLVPHHLIVDRVYIHGDPVNGMRRGIGLNSSYTTVINSHISDAKLVGQDSQAIAGWNGPGPFRIENNYLEGAGEVVMFGGDDPRIDQLMPSDIVFRGNLVTRPMAWRNPILPTPANVRASLGGTGALPAGTYGYRVLARKLLGTTWLRSLPAAEVTVTTGDASAALVQWDPVPGAAEYYVYGRTRGAQTMYWRTTGTSIVDDGLVVGTAGTPPATGTTWQVKNLFELKNARRVQIDYNVIENNWEQAQAGTAILFTPRNQYGRCTWCRVEDVVFEYNIVRRTGGAIQILGWDDERPSSQLTNITIRHNEFSDFGKSYGGNGYFLYMIDEPKDVTVDHNTIISPNGGGVIMADKRASINFVFTNNVARHNTYGIFGSGYSTGLTSIARFFPGSVIERNVLAGGSATKYPAGNFFPTYAEFEAHFLDYPGGNYDLVPGTDWALAGTDGDDLGADMSRVRGRVDGSRDPVVVSTASLPAATQGEPYSAALTASGGTQPYLWEIVAGSLPTGLWLDAATGSITGTPVPEGPFAITVKVADVWGNSALQPLTLTVVGTADPVEILTAALDGGMVGAPYAQALQASGGSGAYVWTVTGGALPAGLSLAANGVLSGTPLEAFSGVVAVTAADAADPGRSASQSYNLIVAGPPNRLPTVTITSPTAGIVVQVGATLTLAAAATDPDGSIARIDFYVNGLPVGTAMAPATTVSWQVNASGPHSVHAVAIDDDGGAAESASVSIATRSEVVLYASDVKKRVGFFQMLADPTAAGGYALFNRNRGATFTSALAAPQSYIEFTFLAEAGKPYRLWLRGRADRNDPANDSVYVQFDNVSTARIGTTTSLQVILEDAPQAGLAGWGWQDNGYGAGILGAPIVFQRTGPQTVRLQPREDGLTIDQIVISPERYLTSAPGAVKNDATIVAK